MRHHATEGAQGDHDDERTARPLQGVRGALHRDPCRARTDIGVLRSVPHGAETRTDPGADANAAHTAPRSLSETREQPKECSLCGALWPPLPGAVSPSPRGAVSPVS